IMHPRTSGWLAVSFLAAGLMSPRLMADAGFAGVPNANPKVANTVAPNVLTPELIETIVAQGAMALDGATAAFPCYGYDGDGTMLPAPGDVQAPGHNVEATKTEPDKNTYLVLENQHGADPGYDYGTHFLFQGHELGFLNAAGAERGYLTRINLDA